MGRLKPGDEHLHYENGSHRWTGGDGTAASDEAWRLQVEAHIDAHRTAAKGANARMWPGRLQQRMVREMPE